MRSQFMELKVQWPLANPDIFLSDTAALSCYDFRPVGTFLNQVGISQFDRRIWHSLIGTGLIYLLKMREYKTPLSPRACLLLCISATAAAMSRRVSIVWCPA